MYIIQIRSQVSIQIRTKFTKDLSACGVNVREKLESKDEK